MAATGHPTVAGNLFVGGYGSPHAVGPDPRVMSSWLPITFVGSAAATGTIAAPGPTISYTSTGGNTLVVAGTVQATASGGLSVSSGITSITDTAGNAWQWSPVNSQFPPSAYANDANGYIAFVAWCVNASAVTSVTVQDSTGFSDTWNVSLSEWAGVTWADYGVSGTAVPGGSTVAMTTVACSTPLDLVVAAMGTLTVSVSTDPGASFTQLPGTTQNNGHKVVGYQILSSIAPPGFVFLGSTGSGFGVGAGTVSLNTPPDLILGDLLIFDVLMSGAGTVTVLPPGFTQQLLITGVNNSANLRYVATKLCDGTEGASLTMTVAGAAAGCVMAYALRGAASATPANVATYTASGYQTGLNAAPLTISGATDATVYGFGGCTSGNTGNPGISSPASGLSNYDSSSFAAHGVVADLGWGTNVVPGSGTANTALDVLDWGMDFPLRPLGIGGQVTYQWSMTGSQSNAIAAVSFGPAGVPVAVQPGMQAF